MDDNTIKKSVPCGGTDPVLQPLAMSLPILYIPFLGLITLAGAVVSALEPTNGTTVISSVEREFLEAIVLEIEMESVRERHLLNWEDRRRLLNMLLLVSP